MTFRFFAFLLSAVFLVPASAQELAWPVKPIRWLVPFAPGGPADVVSRILAAGLAERTGQPNVVENHPGAQGNIAHAAVSKSAPDGHTVLFVVPSVITNPFYLKASIDPFRDLAAVIYLDTASMVLLASPGFAPASTADVLAFIKANPGKVSCGASGARNIAKPVVSIVAASSDSGIESTNSISVNRICSTISPCSPTSCERNGIAVSWSSHNR